VALADARQVVAVDANQGRVVATVEVPGNPTTLMLDARSEKLYVSCANEKGMVCVIDPATMKIVQSIPVGHTATGMAITPDGSKLFVCNRFNNDVSVLSMPAGKELARVKVGREPIGAAITLDGRRFS